MADITADRVADKRCTQRLADPLAPGALIPTGAAYVLDADGFATPATASSRGPVRGIALRRADAAAGDTVVHGATGCYLFVNDGSMSLVHTRTSNAKVVDCHTVGASGSCNVGRTIDVTDDGVWVLVGYRKR